MLKVVFSLTPKQNHNQMPIFVSLVVKILQLQIANRDKI